MNCNKCGKEILNDQSVCYNCGENMIHQENNNHQVNINYNNAFDNEELIATYMRKNTNEIKNSKFSVLALLFGAYYLVYKKMYLYGLIFIAITTIISFIFTSSTYLVTIPIHIFLAKTFDEIYLKHAEKKVNMIKNNNRNKSNKEILEICNKKGGTNILITILLFVFLILMVYINYAFGISSETNPKEIIGYTWVTNDNTSLHLNKNKTFKLYQIDVNSNNKLYEGTYTVYKGLTAVKFVGKNVEILSSEINDQIDSFAILNNMLMRKSYKGYYAIILNITKEFENDNQLDVEANSVVLFTGYYYKDSKELDLTNFVSKASSLFQREEFSE